MFPTIKLADQYADVQEGDLIQLEKGETVMRGRVGMKDDSEGKPTLYVDLAPGGFYLSVYSASGHTLHIIEKAKPELPKEPAMGAVIRQPTQVPVYRRGNGWFYITIPERSYTWEEVTGHGGTEFEVLYDGYAR